MEATNNANIVVKACDRCGVVFELSEEKKCGVGERQKLYPDMAEALKQELICCEDCAQWRMVYLL